MTWYRFGRMQEAPLTAAVVREVVEEARGLRASARSLPLDEIVEVLDATGALLKNPEHPIRKRILEEMPDLVNFDRTMVEAGLDSLGSMLARENLWTRLRTDLGNPGALDGFVWEDSWQGLVRAEPRGVVAHVAAGNVFVGAVDSLIQGLVTKNVNLLKMAGADPRFPLLFAQALLEADPHGTVSKNFALLPFRGGDREVEAVLKQGCHTIVVYGGADAVAAYRQDLPIETHLVEYGPKYSLVVMDGQLASPELAREIARDFVMWEQSACSSPQVVYVLNNGAQDVAHDLAIALDDWAIRLPVPPIRPNEQVEITRARELARVTQALGKGELLASAGQQWTVIYEDSPEFRVSCQHRTAYVKPLQSLDELQRVLEPYAPYLQTVAVAASERDVFAWSDRLVAMGADRIVEPGQMSRRKHGTPHDGTRGLQELIRWTSLSRPGRFEEPFDYLPDEQRDRITLARLNRLLDFVAEKAPFYRVGKLESLEQLGQLPLVTPDAFRAHLPPDGEGILTAPLGDSYSFGSGGTTGKPKFVYRTVEETHHNARALGKGLYLSGFARPGDVVGNLLYAGNLWASFVSMNMALEHCGAHILPIGGHIEMDAILAHLMAFRPQAVMSVPSTLISLAQRVQRDGLDLRIPKLGYGGEHFFPEAQKQVAQVLGVERIVSLGYATNDTGAIAFACEACRGGEHHVHEPIHRVEIVDPETGQPAQEGKIVVTNLVRFLMPTLRFEVGDMGRWIQEPCPCGRTLRRFELLGRSDEVLIIGGFNVGLEMVARCVGRVPGLSGHFRMLGRLQGMLDQLVVEAESETPVSEERAEELARELEAAIHKEKAEFAVWESTGSIAPPKGVVVSPDGLPRNPRTGKIKQVVEERAHGA